MLTIHLPNLVKYTIVIAQSLHIYQINEIDWNLFLLEFFI